MSQIRKICQLWKNKYWHCSLSPSEGVTNYRKVILCVTFHFRGLKDIFSFGIFFTKLWNLFSFGGFHRWISELQPPPWLCLFPFMQTSAKLSDFLQPSYTLSQSKLTLDGLISHWLSTSMKQLLLVVVEILFSRHKQFWRFGEQILLLMLGLLKFTPGLISTNTECK